MKRGASKASTQSGEEQRADKLFAARLEELQLLPGKSAADIARDHGLDIQRLYVLHFFARLWRFDDPRLAAEIASFRRIAKILRLAARGVMFFDRVHMPCFEDLAGGARRRAARRDGAPQSALRNPLAHPLEGFGPLAEWKAIDGAFPMPMEEIHTSKGVLPLTLEPMWLSPFSLPAGLVRAFDGRSGGVEPLPKANDWTRCAIAETTDFKMIAELLEQIASQAEAIHAATFRGGRRVERDKKVFRRRFAEYAMTCSGRKLDVLGAALYSLTFGAIEVEEYARLRRRDEHETKEPAPAKRPKKRKTVTPR